jgi:hypothetical protein
MIIKKETIKEGKEKVTVYHVDKEYDDNAMEKKMNKFVKPDDISLILEDNSDVYTADGKLLLRFRKNAIENEEQIDKFYDNVIHFAKNVSSNRGSATGSKSKNVNDNPKVMSNIFGYFDRWSPSQKVIFKKHNKTPKISVRPCRFNMYYPDKYQKTIPYIQSIDKLYKELVPDKYKLQRKKANETHFKIPNTSFTTVTTNVNYQTSIHTDKGDDIEGFGNLAVIDKGGYTGGETCFPQYGIGVNVRRGDILFMDVHQPHANLPIKKKTDDTIRLSVVCYLRKNVWSKTRGTSKATYERHNKTLKKIMTTGKVNGV